MKEFKSKNVFVDTSIYVKENFQYLSSKFDKLKSYSLEDKIKLFTHKIIIDEVKSNIVEEINKGISSIKRVKSEGKIFWNLPQEKIFTVFNKHESNYYKKLLFSQLEDFIKSSKYSFIPSSYDVDLIFQNYFTKEAPFGKGKKKAEFPDAFVLSAIENWCKTNDEKVYLLSNDSDWKNYANNSKYMFIVSSIEELLEIITFHYEELSKYAIEIFEQNIDKIKERIESEFLSLGFILEDVDGDAEDIDVAEIDIIEKYLISLESDSYLIHSVAQFDIIVSVSFSANVHYGDESTASYDSEEKRLYIWEYIDKRVEQTDELTVDMKLSFNNQHNIANIDSIHISNPKNIWISVEDDQYPYK